jgi:hypothetical protein
MDTCKLCLLHENLQGVILNADGICNYCSGYNLYKPYGEEHLLKIFKKACGKRRLYDALVPLSGGKDSTYVLYLAVKKYKLRVLAYTLDNGFMSDLALKNIESAIKFSSVDHIWFRYSHDLIYKLYRTALLHSGEICGICGTAIERSMLKVSEAFHTPLILLGHSPVEDNSFTTEDLYDQARIKAIMKQNPGISVSDMHRFLIYPNLNFISSFVLTKLGRFGKKVNPLYFIDLPGDQEISEILVREMGWNDSTVSEYTRHFDCIAEPFTNHIREKRFGYSRRICQLSNMIRTGELTREKAEEIYRNDQKNPDPPFLELIMQKMNVTQTDIQKALAIERNVYQDQVSAANRIFAFARKILKKHKH